MENFTYKIKNKIFRFSKEADKIKRPSYDELLNYKLFKNKQIMSLLLVLDLEDVKIGLEIFNSHSNWIGTCENFLI